MKLSIDNVSKRYTSTLWGIKDFSLEIENGVLGLLGPNGAGKSTLMRILATISKPTTGKVFWNDVDISKNPKALRDELGYLPQDFGVYPNLNAIEFLKYMAAIKGMDKKIANRRIEELICLLNLSEKSKVKIGSYSGGMRQRIGIAQALLNDPKLLIVDEPTVGLDPEERVRFRNLISDLSLDRIIILSTHIVSDIESTASKIALINKGNLLTKCTIQELLCSVENKVWECIVQEKELSDVRNKYIISSSVRQSDGMHLRVVTDNILFANKRLVSPTLEDAYLYYISDSRGNEK
ncbi:ABC transporter ATP-binding protein [Oceanirhabdus sp. W0125-5]|uniref:ABC transporter ATP-binding protein n=1 Tax=Oceanirhabdus sp. W0125-5 TaxID=2999116 RepID=UPI0022F2F543|nr:ABC transporter ATP-binding protein [Oceanirhabdus sp. W0125-5]WBW97168.1 ABC transporter ATP-binding protein [Oceanirhabdus sp. W0125-5]